MEKKKYQRPDTWVDAAMGEQLMAAVSVAVGASDGTDVIPEEQQENVGWGKSNNLWDDAD